MQDWTTQDRTTTERKTKGVALDLLKYIVRALFPFEEKLHDIL